MAEDRPLQLLSEYYNNQNTFDNESPLELLRTFNDESPLMKDCNKGNMDTLNLA